MKTPFKALALVAALAGASVAAQAQTVTLKLHHFLSPVSMQHTKMFKSWCDDLAKDSANRLQCQIYPSMQLGGTPPQLFDQARDGVVDVVWTLPGSTPGRFSRMEVFELPFIMSDAEGTSAAAWEYYEKHAKDEFKDVKVIALHTHGPGNIFTAKKQVKTIEDLKGLKLRGPTRPVTKLLTSLGATPIGLPLPQVPEALSKGVIDGAVTTYEVSPVIKLDELANFTTETDPGVPGLYTALFVFAMNKARYDTLPADLKAVIDKHSGRDTSVRFGKMMGDNDVPGKARIVAAKHTLYTIPKTELARWQQASANVEDEWVAEVSKKGADGKALLADARALIAKNAKK